MSAFVYQQILQPASGTYIVWSYLPAARRIRVGSLGEIEFEAGYYGYVGSAFGPGGIRARLGRHFSQRKKTRWHIDYLSRTSRVQGAWISYGSQRLEHYWAGVLQGLPGASLPVARFGASDCHCKAHLVGFLKPPLLKIFMQDTGSPPGSVLRVRQICERNH